MLGDPVDVRRLDDPAAVTAKRLKVMLVGLDDENVVRLGQYERLANGCEKEAEQ